MRVQGADYQQAIEHLPAGATLVLQDVPWEDYEHLLANIGNRRPGLRITYNRGRLYVMSPLRKHEILKDFVGRLVHVLAEELRIPIEFSGSTTWKNKRKLAGFEPDACFHIANAPAVIGKQELRVGIDPPPDLAVEIDATHESLGKFPLYAAFGIPELWIYSSERNAFQMFELLEGGYKGIAASRSFPMLTPEVLANLFERCEKVGQTKASAEFRQWLRESCKR